MENHSTAIHRFLAKVDSSAGCWTWGAKKDTGGYGMFYYDGKLRRSHRVAYQFFKGDLVDGLVIDHLCGNKACVNPDHLEQVTQQENMARMVTQSVRGLTWKCGPVGADGLTVCGTPGSYRRGCRCDECKAQQASRVKDYRQRKAAA